MKITKFYDLIQKSLNQRVLEYSLCENESEDGKSYGIQLASNSKNSSERITIENISSKKDFIINLINILYENSIDTIHFKDIVEDYIENSNY